MNTISKEAILQATLPHVAFDGWTPRSLDMGRQDAGASDFDAARHFPNGVEDVLEAFMDSLDAQMNEQLALLPLEKMRLHEKVLEALMLRFKAAAPHREAVRKALAHYAFPLNMPKGAKRLYKTVDAVWRAVQDHPTDFSFYTKRATLAGIYSASVFYWLDDHSEDFGKTRAFIERRMANVLSFTRAKNRIFGKKAS